VSYAEVRVGVTLPGALVAGGEKLDQRELVDLTSSAMPEGEILDRALCVCLDAMRRTLAVRLGGVRRQLTPLSWTTDYIVLRLPEDANDSLREWAWYYKHEGKWIAREGLGALNSRNLMEPDQGWVWHADATKRFEIREDGAVAQVFLIQMGRGV
jgi:hypothetical protein